MLSMPRRSNRNPNTRNIVSTVRMTARYNHSPRRMSPIVSAGVLQARRDSVDREQQQRAQPRRFGVVRRTGPQRRQRAELQVRERVDVRVAQVDGGAEDAP